MQHLVKDMVNLLQAYLRIKTCQPEPDYAGAIDLFEQRAQRDGFVCMRVTLPFVPFDTIAEGNHSGRTDETTPFVVSEVESKRTVREALIIVQPGNDQTLPALALNHHMDVVPSLDFDGALVDDIIYGRGTQDMKGVGVAHYGALLHLVKTHEQPRRTVCLVLVPDEELGGFTGAGQLVETEAFALLNVGYVLDEGLPSGNPQVLLLKVSERRPLQILVTSVGQAAHASRLMAVNPVHELLMFLARVVTVQVGQQRMIEPFVPFDTIAEGNHSGRTVCDEPVFVPPGVISLDERDKPPFALSVFRVSEKCIEGCERRHEPILPGQLLSFNITSLQAGVGAVNVIPGTATATVDIRIPPDVHVDDVCQMINELLVECPGVSYSVLACALETSAPVDQNSAFYQMVAGAVAAAGVRAVPHAAEESSDLRFYRAKGMQGLGLTPFTCKENIHGVNESVPVADIALGCQIFYNILADFCL